MPATRLTRIGLRNFKSIGDEQQIVDLKPLTILIGRNSSGKSTVLQSLLLLQQTLEDPRREVQLNLQGPHLRAASLRDLTHGWPEDMVGKGPEITLRWVWKPGKSFVERLIAILASIRSNLGEHRETKFAKLLSEEFHIRLLEKGLHTEMIARFAEAGSIPVFRSIHLQSLGYPSTVGDFAMDIEPSPEDAAYTLQWKNGEGVAAVMFDHFLPFEVKGSASEHFSFDLLNTFEILYKYALRGLAQLLYNLCYIGPSREDVSAYYALPTSKPSRKLLPTGGNMPELLYGRRDDTVHYAALPALEPEQPFELPTRITTRSLEEATEECLQFLGIDGELSFDAVPQAGLFLLRVGRATLDHVGRGVGHVLPVLVAGLLADPLLGKPIDADTLDAYLAACPSFPCVAMEEVESHLHPKAQSRLAHILVTIARSGRQFLIETHSDHLVRKLRGLVARAASGSDTERWLLDNVSIVEVEQDQAGATLLRQASLTPEGGIESWPSDFMDESSEEERAIYFAATDKSPPVPMPAEEGLFEDATPEDETPEDSEQPGREDG